MTSPEVDPRHPSAPRVYDYLLGGKDNFAADRELAEEMVRVHPGLRALAAGNRTFVLKAVTWTAGMLGIAQFIDLGCGLPGKPSVHDAARQAQPDARVAYVDRDPVVISHVAALQAGEGLAALEADVSDPGRVLAAPALLEVINLREPVCVILGGTLSAMDAGMAGETVAGYAERLAAGSAVVISCASYCDPALAGAMAAAFGAAGAWANHSLEDVQGFFDAGGLRVVRGQAADVGRWPLLPSGCAREACVLGGIGIKD